MSNFNSDKVDLALRMIEDGQGNLHRQVSLRADAYLDADQARQLALHILDMVDLLQPIEPPNSSAS